MYSDGAGCQTVPTDSISKATADAEVITTTGNNFEAPTTAVDERASDPQASKSGTHPAKLDQDRDAHTDESDISVPGYITGKHPTYGEGPDGAPILQGASHRVDEGAAEGSANREVESCVDKEQGVPTGEPAGGDIKSKSPYGTDGAAVQEPKILTTADANGHPATVNQDTLVEGDSRTDGDVYIDRGIIGGTGKMSSNGSVDGERDVPNDDGAGVDIHATSARAIGGTGAVDVDGTIISYVADAVDAKLGDNARRGGEKKGDINTDKGSNADVDGEDQAAAAEPNAVADN